MPKANGPRRDRSFRGDLCPRSLALTGTVVLGVLCLANRPSHALDQLGRVVIAGQVLRLNILVEQDVGVLLGAAVALHDDCWHKPVPSYRSGLRSLCIGVAGKEEGKPCGASDAKAPVGSSLLPRSQLKHLSA